MGSVTTRNNSHLIILADGTESSPTGLDNMDNIRKMTDDKKIANSYLEHQGISRENTYINLTI